MKKKHKQPRKHRPKRRRTRAHRQRPHGRHVARPQLDAGFDAVIERMQEELAVRGIDLDDPDELADTLADALDDESCFDLARELDPAGWLDIDETTQQRLLRWYHHVTGDAEDMNESELDRHVLIHLIVENQLAMNEPPNCRRTLARLMDEGLSRHDAVHAIGSVLAGHLFGMLREHKPYDAERYTRELDALDRATWEESIQPP
jgi:hypothetical protein